MKRAAMVMALWLAVGVGPAVRAQTAPSPTAPVGAAGWRRDLDFLVGALESVHPRPFHRVPRARFDSAVRALRDRLPGMTDPQAMAGLMRILALMNDGHTSLQPGGKVTAFDRWFPVKIDRFVDGYFVIATGPAYHDLLGARVVRIGGRPVESVWESVAEISSGDNQWSRMEKVPLLLMMPVMAEGLGYASSTALELEIVRGDTRRTAKVAPVKGERSIRVMLEDQVPGDSSVGLPEGDLAASDLVYRHPSDPFWFRHDRSTGLLYAQWNLTQDFDRPVHLDDDTTRISLVEFNRRVLARLDSGDVRTLVIDLRNNPGGNNSLIQPFVAGLASRPINTRGRLFVITGRKTYSAAMNFTSLLENRTAAIFVGEPPGGSPSHYGDATGFELPASRIQFGVSTLHWDLGVDPTDVREEQQPEIWVAPAFADRVAGRDPALAAIRAWKPGESVSERLIAIHRAKGIDSAVVAARAIAAAPTSPWGANDQQLLAFAHAVIQPGASGDVIYRAFRLVTELYPTSPQAWFELGRVYQRGRRPAEAVEAFGRARALRPASDLIGRFYEAAVRQVPPKR